MTIKEIIKAELKRLKTELVENGENTEFEQGRISAFEDADVFIDSLPEEPTWTNEDDYLRTETIQHLKELIRIENKERFGIDSKYYQRDIDWLKELPKKKDEPVSEDLEKEMCNFFEKMPLNDLEYIFEHTFQSIAKHFVEWQKQKMMKNAVEAEVMLGESTDATAANFFVNPAPENVEDGDKVKLIISKEKK